MRLDRLRAGELVCLAGATILLVSLFGTWARAEDGARIHEETGWSAIGIGVVVPLVALAVAGFTVATLTVARIAVAAPVSALVTTIFLGLVTTLILLVRLTLAQPALGFEIPDASVDVLAPAWVALGACAAITAGAWYALADERTDAADDPPPDVPVRPAPPPTI